MGRAAYQRRAWRQAYALLSACHEEAPLGPDDLERLAWAAELAGELEAFMKGMERLYELHLAAGESRRAARAAFWVGLRAQVIGEAGRSNAWLVRAQRLVEAEVVDCAEQGLLLLPVAFRHHMLGELESCQAVAARAAAIGDRFGDPDLSALARNVEGRALIRQGNIDRGMALLDESMLAAMAGHVSPVITGLVYCGVIASCQRIYAIDRAREWTAALSDWCEGQEGLIPFRGPCLIHRAELLQVAGAWPEALDEARNACGVFGPGERQFLADAHYQQGEIHRLRGEFELAEQAYKAANVHGGEPQPGLALMRLTQGRADVAASAIHRVVAEAREPLARAAVLPAAVEIAIATGDLATARAACRSLDEIAATFATEVLEALAAHARARLHLAEGDAQAALGPLRRALWVWQKTGAPYPTARVRVDLARACQALGDHEGARLEREIARAVFDELGAAPDAAALSAAAGPGEPAARPAHGLSQRELQVLRLVATGKTNKVIARELFLSEKTIDRHLSNMFNKLNVDSRTAATAWAYEHHLV
ncbi:MAG TPA: response regulator transcription factor [Polyangia bacterium]|nr:response regulator transcription factor [Polyangia bacterium]